HNRGGKPAFFYTATMHGDEPVGYCLMLRLIHYLLNNYDTDAQVRQLVDNVDIWICPLENPDGTYRSSNTQINSWYSTRYNYNGDDMNRSYPIIGQPVAKNYPPEVQAMMDFGAERRFTLSANFHGGAEVVNYPWDTWTTIQRAHADQSWWDYIGRCYADTCHAVNASYMTDENNGVTEGGDWYVITGSRQDYFNYYLGCREMTVEVSSDKVVNSNLLPTFWNRNRQSLLNYIGESLNGFRGIVTDSVTNQPIAARVFVENHDEDNSHTYSRLPYGDYHRPIRRGTWQVTFSAEGYFPKTLTLTATDGQCLVQDVQLVPTNISVADRNLPKVSVYPNPASNEVRVTSDQEEIVLVELYDLAGRRLVRQTVGELSASLDLSSCASGVYNLTVTFANGKVSKRVVKQ
ncbi:MAG: T9SS type A sorting domain-containing protein, partial [Bacteroidales bacterium]|nr:T9SS type A sorting domain-containing protein [Bacteroidales bacterium]